jgi:hypothetical protein
MTLMNCFLTAGLIFGVSIFLGPSTADAQMVEKTAAAKDSTAHKPPKPVILSAGMAFLGKYGRGEGGWPVQLEDGLSVGATCQIPLARHIYLGPCLDYHRAKPYTSLFLYGAELTGDLEIDGPLRFQAGAGLGYGILHGDRESADTDGKFARFAGRLLWQPPHKIGGALELVRTDLGADGSDSFTTLRIGVVF